jgi:ATP-dependent protease ClpP protease subunit
MADYVRECMTRLKARGSPDIEIDICSEGGSAAAGLCIFDELRLYKGKKVGTVYTDASSMAAIILQGCTTRRIARHAHLLIHNHTASGVQESDFYGAKLKQNRVHARELRSQLMRILSERSGTGKRILKKLCDMDKSLNAATAWAAGLVDEII